MMLYRFGYGGMMDGGWGVFGGLTCLVILVDAILLGIWLWKQINK